MTDTDHKDELRKRVGDFHFRQRVGVERDHVDQIFGRGRNLFHIENWYSVHGLIRFGLKAVGLYGRGQRNTRDVKLVRNLVKLPHLPAAFDGFKLLHLSDLHLDMSGDFVAALLARVSTVEHDACVITGDFRARTYGAIDDAVASMGRLIPALSKPVLGILGNHDFIEMVPCLERLGVSMLVNESFVLECDGARIYLAGVDDPHYYRMDNLEKCGAGIPGDAVSVLLAHSPEIYRQAAHAGFDLYLCGHTHGGQICLPGGRALSYNAKIPRRLGRGVWRHHDMQGYTSVGAGSSVVNARYNCQPEMTLHVLKVAR